jgi:hypothetical protein
MHVIHQAQDAKEWTEPTGGCFAPEIGLRVRKMFDGRNYFGTVTKDSELKEVPPEVEGGSEAEEGKPKEVMMWEVTFDDGDIDDMDWNDLFRCRADRPTRTAPCRGRRLQSLELFCGTCCYMHVCMHGFKDLDHKKTDS